MTDKQQIGTIDLTPTWVGILPALIAALEDGTDEGKRIAREELRRMATAADRYNEAHKVLFKVREALQFANDTPEGPISDTIWMMHTPETLFDFIDAYMGPFPAQCGQPQAATPIEASRVEVEFMISWAKANPELFEQRFNEFFENHKDAWKLKSSARKGYIVLIATKE